MYCQVVRPNAEIKEYLKPNGPLVFEVAATRDIAEVWSYSTVVNLCTHLSPVTIRVKKSSSLTATSSGKVQIRLHK